MADVVRWLDWDFAVYPYNSDWGSVGGVYIFAGRISGILGGIRWYPFYAGQTGDFSVHIPAHTRWDEAVWMRATHIHILFEDREEERVRIEEALIEGLRPPLNYY